MPEGAPRLAAIAAAAAMTPGGATPGTSTYPPRHNPGGGSGTSTAAADAAAAAKLKATGAAAAALAAAVKRAEKGQERESKLLPVGTWCHKGTCRWKHGTKVPCTSDPDWVGPLDPEIEKDAAHVARIEVRREAAAKRLHEEGKRSSPVPKALLKRPAARPGGAATLAVDDVACSAGRWLEPERGTRTGQGKAVDRGGKRASETDNYGRKRLSRVGDQELANDAHSSLPPMLMILLNDVETSSQYPFAIPFRHLCKGYW